MSESSDRESPFIRYLCDLVKDENRAALAALRRGLGKEPGEAPEMFPYVVRWVPPGNDAWHEKTYYLVASLFALHQKATTAGEGATNLGASLRWLRHKSDSESVEKRFVALLNSHGDDVAEHLRRVVALLKAQEIPIDWTQLLRDVQRWNAPSRFVQRSWARAYWSDTGVTPAPETTQEPEAVAV